MYNSLGSLDFAAVSQFGAGESAMASRFVSAALYEKVLRQGKWHAVWNKIRRRDNHLRDLAHLDGASERKPARSAGVVNVPLSRIVGSEGRVRDFDREFRPLSEHTRERWIGIAAARRNRVALPPVELIQVGDSYYVRDGHHRISVARAAGQVEIESRIAHALAIGG